MKNRLKLVVLCGLMAFPMMVAFQNCSRTVAMQMTDEINGKPLDTDLLPNGITDVDQQQPSSSGGGVSVPPGNNTPSSGGDGATQPVDNPTKDSISGGNNSGSSGEQESGEKEEDSQMRYQVEDPENELREMVNEAPSECDYDAHESQNDANGILSEDGHSITHIRGSKILSAADFNGETEIDEISDAYGKIVLCGLHVKSMHDSGGALILVGSVVDDLSGHKGTLGINESRAVLNDSKAKIQKQNTNAPEDPSLKVKKGPVKK